MVEENNTPEHLLNEDEYAFIQNNMGKNSFEMSHMVSSQPSSLNMLDPNLSPSLFLPFEEESTMPLTNIEYKFEPISNYQFPPSQPLTVCNVEYSGPYSFEAFVDPSGLKNPWEYSSIYNKVYIDMKQKFPINFSIKPNGDNGSFYIRAMPMYEEHRHEQEIVHRCICHQQPHDPMNQGIPDHIIQHIMRCDNSYAQYFGSKETNDRLSVVIPLSKPQVGTDSVKEFFMFVCKNSCVGGMNRRPIQIIFTLENECGEVLGRRVLCVRICSCPKRDKEKEEQKKEKNIDPPGKKRKLEKKVISATETVDSKPFNININILGEQNYKDVLKYCANLMATDIVKLEARNASAVPFRRALNEINSLYNK